MATVGKNPVPRHYVEEPGFNPTGAEDSDLGSLQPGVSRLPGPSRPISEAGKVGGDEEARATGPAGQGKPEPSPRSELRQCLQQPHDEPAVLPVHEDDEPTNEPTDVPELPAVAEHEHEPAHEPVHEPADEPAHEPADHEPAGHDGRHHHALQQITSPTTAAAGAEVPAEPRPEVPILNLIFMEEILDSILDDFDFTNYCNICNSCNVLCDAPYCYVLASKELPDKSVEHPAKTGVAGSTGISDKVTGNSCAQDLKPLTTKKCKLTQYFRHEKDSRSLQSPILPVEEVDKSETKTSEGQKLINIAFANPGGLNENKSKVIENICNNNQIQFIVISETNSYGRQVPKIGKEMVAFHRNRNQVAAAKGGVCIFVHKSLAPDTVVLDKGDNEEGDEFISVKCNAFKPPIIIAALYGRQENRPRLEVRNGWKRFFGFLESYKERGCMVVAGGDWNCCLGRNLGLVNNDPFVSYGGKEVLKEINNGGWTLVNGMTSDCHKSHFDRTSQVERCLDYAITNVPDIISHVTTDPDRKITPYVMMLEKGKIVGRKFTDHRTLAFSMSLTKNKEGGRKEKKVTFVKSEESIRKFAEKTNEVAMEMMPEVMEKMFDINSVVKKMDRLLLKAKYASHKPMRPSKARKEVLDDNKMFWEVTKSLEKELENIANLKINNKIFSARKDKILEERKEQMSAVLNKEGRLVDEKMDIVEVLMEYNQVLLSRNQHPAEFEEIFKTKREIMNTLEKGEISQFESFTEEEWERVVDKVRAKNKAMFKDFLETGEDWKRLVFKVLKAIYEREIIPDEFLTTTLIPLFKKGDPRDPSNYRYLHIRLPMPRLLEMLVYQKLEPTYNICTGENQLGGMPKSSTVEHLVSMVSVISSLEKQKGGAVVTACDVKKCFDSVHLSDMGWFLVKNSADIKATRMLNKLTGSNNVKVMGASRTFSILDGVGQGGVNAARITSGGSTECFERNMELHPNPMTHLGVKVALDEFVDDAKAMDWDSMGAKASGMVITNTLDELALQAHGDKTVQIIVGHKQYIDKMKAEMEMNPTEVQGFKVKLTEQEKYLGMLVTSTGVKEMVDINIKEKRKKLAPVSQAIRRMSRQPKMLRIGSMKSACLLIQAQCVPILLYSCEAWLNVSDEQYQMMEDIFRKTILKIVSLPKSSNYEAVLHEIGNFHIEQWMDSAKIKFFQRLMHDKHEGKLFRMMREEIIQKVEGGFMEDVRKLCEKYRLPNVTLHYVRPDDINNAIKEKSREKIWMSVMLAKSVPMLVGSRKIKHDHHMEDFTPMEARAITCFNTGNLVFKTLCPQKFRTQDNDKDRSCLERACGGVDSYSHVRFECKFYSTKFVKTGSPILDNAKYLVKLNEERIKKWKTPLVIPVPPL